MNEYTTNQPIGSTQNDKAKGLRGIKVGDGDGEIMKEFRKGCVHDFQFAGEAVEANADNYFYHPVAYSVCRKCGEVRKNNL